MTKRRGKRRSKRGQREEKRPSARHLAGEFELALQRAERWIDRDRPERAVELLEPLLASAPDVPEFHAALGYARAQSGDVWGALSPFEAANRLGAEPDHLLSMAGVCIEAGLPIHALRVFREIIDRGVSTPLMKEARAAAASLEQDLADVAQRLNCPKDQVEQGLLDMERGHRAANDQDFGAAIAAHRRAIKRLGDWPPPHNNLSQALFYDGQPETAIREMRRVLADHPTNLPALANGIRFLTWSGREEEARELWERLKDVAPGDTSQRMAKAEAAAMLREHERVCEMLQPAVEGLAAQELPRSLLNRAGYFLAVAEANTGRRRQAERRLRSLQDAVPLAAETLAALEAGQSGTGWADHFRYFHLLEVLPAERVDELLDVAAREDDLSPKGFGRRVKRFAERFPQIVHLAEKMIWEERQPEAGIDMLRTIGTPEAYAALRRFGLSQAGSDHARAEALTALVEAGEIKEGERVRAWFDGEWREIELRLQQMPEGALRPSDYAPRVIDTLNRAFTAYQWDEIEQAEELFERVLELDPNVKEAYNNLGTIYARREEHERAKEMFKQAVEIDPLYVYPLCNLVNYMLDEERVEDAEALLEPLPGGRELLPQGTALWDVTRARILVQREDYDGAKQLLQTTLEATPD